nr:DUF4230 domain-containing protein [uncultured Prevotella sp.]
MENKIIQYLKNSICFISKQIWFWPATILAAIVLIIGLYLLNKDSFITISQNKKIDITPTQIRSIEAIGEWEFLAISNEELVDTVYKGFLGKKSELVRIYYGTLRLGIDLREAQPGWIKVEQDTIFATLPPIKLLDKDFIDEAKTLSFYQSGSWSEQTREHLYQKAYNAMLQRCMTPSNIKSAQENASRQFYHLLTSMGYDFVKIKFQDQKAPERPSSDLSNDSSYHHSSPKSDAQASK